MDPSTSNALRVLERLGLALLLLAAFVPRVRDWSGPFDREMEGFQGSCFATFCVNYERLGPGAHGGYPVFNIDLPDDPAIAPEVYANHPPTVPLLCWATLKLLGPEGWDRAWREDRAPEGVEPLLRLPFLAFHLLGLVAFWWALRQAGGPRLALLGLAVLAMTPISTLYAKLINYENPSLALVCLGYGFHARYLRGLGRGNLLGLGLSFGAAAAVTFAPLFFVPPLVLQVLLRAGWRRALEVALVVGLAAAVPIAAHGVWVKLALSGEDSQTVLQRAFELTAPLFSGEQPLGEWLRRQALRTSFFLSPTILAAALGGLGWIGWRALRSPRPDPAAPVQLAPPLLAGGACLMLLFYTHTYDGADVWGGQTVFLLNLAPGAAAAAAALLDALARPLARLRGGIAPLVVATSLVGMPGLARTNEVRHRWREPGPRDDAAQTSGPAAPLPDTLGRELAELLPAGSVGYYPRALGFNQAPAFYAWRTLVDVDVPSFGSRLGFVELLGLGDRPRYLILPVNPDPAVEAQAGEVRELLRSGGEPSARSAIWEVWRLE